MIFNGNVMNLQPQEKSYACLLLQFYIAYLTILLQRVQELTGFLSTYG